MTIISFSEAQEAKPKFIRRKLPKAKEPLSIEDAITLIKQNGDFMIQDIKYFLSLLDRRTYFYCLNMIHKARFGFHGSLDQLNIVDCLLLLKNIRLIENYARREIRKNNRR